MTHSLQDTLESQTAELQQARAEADGEISRTAAEVVRLTTMLQAATAAIGAAEVRAADAVSAEEAGDDGLAIAAVATAKARRDAVATALRRAQHAETSARAAIAPLEKKRRRIEAERKLSAIPPALADIDLAIAHLRAAIPIVEEAYRTGMNALFAELIPTDGMPGPVAISIDLVERVKQEIGFVSTSRPGHDKTIAAAVTAIIDNGRARALESENSRQAPAVA